MGVEIQKLIVLFKIMNASRYFLLIILYIQIYVSRSIEFYDGVVSI